MLMRSESDFVWLFFTALRQVHLDAAAMHAYQAELESASAAPLPDDGATALACNPACNCLPPPPLFPACRRHLRRHAVPVGGAQLPSQRIQLHTPPPPHPPTCRGAVCNR